jgi:hypothetical protein
MRVLALIALVAGAVLMASAAKQGWSIRSLCPLLMLLGFVWGAGRGLQAGPRGHLQWDGERWYWVWARRSLQ